MILNSLFHPSRPWTWDPTASASLIFIKRNESFRWLGWHLAPALSSQICSGLWSTPLFLSWISLHKDTMRQLSHNRLPCIVWGHLRLRNCSDSSATNAVISHIYAPHKTIPSSRTFPLGHRKCSLTQNWRRLKSQSLFHRVIRGWDRFLVSWGSLWNQCLGFVYVQNLCHD